ncbi:DUF4856 domain-containing protein, partial [Flavobacteriaceae bacterium]|nr:DUF4856 domain-containing protein [Flavobacteriaceae bacterium]
VPGETITETVIVNNPLAPDSYSFTRDGLSTVYYTGQSARLEMAKELGGALNTSSFTENQIKTMFNDGTGFTNSTLDASGKKVGNKTGASTYSSATIKPLFEEWISDATSNVFPAWNSDASAGVAGQITDADGGRTVRVNTKGLELNQVFMKGLIGAFAADQIINNYLTSSKLDGAKDDNDAGVLYYTSPNATEANVTKMEHYWDEGFGYLYGLDNQTYPELGKGVLLNKYLKKVESDEPGISKKIYDAFALGRAAIVSKNYTLRDQQAKIVKSELSKVIGYKAAYYLRSGGAKKTAGKTADAFHALSEGYGFILSLQFTQNQDGVPYMSNTEVNAMLSELMAGNGLWDRTEAELEEMATEIDAATLLPKTN